MDADLIGDPGQLAIGVFKGGEAAERISDLGNLKRIGWQLVGDVCDLAECVGNRRHAEASVISNA